MVIDTAVLIAILLGEEDADTYLQILDTEYDLLISAAALVEATAVMLRRGGPGSVDDLNEFLDRAEIEIVPVSVSQARMAQRAYLSYGKGRHVAGLNFGDCFAYALTKETGEKLLFKGSDFSRTDISPALSP
ncbi:MAG: type II toxin-antitoxin system VapC family toxin [Sphingomonadales bacterium]